jgi:hypothetical protein
MYYVHAILRLYLLKSLGVLNLNLLTAFQSMSIEEVLEIKNFKMSLNISLEPLEGITSDQMDVINHFQNKPISGKFSK